MASLEKFRERFAAMYNSWKKADLTGFSGTDAVAIATGVYDADADIGYLKSFAVVTWLFGAELQGAALFFSASQVVVAVSPQDLPPLASLSSKPANGLPAIAVHSNEDPALDPAVRSALGDYSKIAVLVKELPEQHGPTAKIVTDLAKKSSVNVAPAIAAVLSVKDSDEVSLIKRACYLSARVLKQALVEKIERTIDEDRKTSHLTLSDVAEDGIVNPSRFKFNFKAETCDPCYPPIIQSSDSKTNRQFDLRPSAESDDTNLAFGCIVVSIGARHQFYCGNISRTLLIGPSKIQELVYGIVLHAQEAAIKALVPGAALKNSHAAAAKVLKNEGNELRKKNPDLPELLPAMTKNVGFGTGIEFRDSAFVLSSKNDNKVEKGMAFYVAVGVQNVVDKDNGNFAVLLGDTVFVREAGKGAEVFTAQARKDYKHIRYDIQPDGDDDDEVVELDNRRGRGRSNANGHSRSDRKEEVLNAPRGRRRAAADTAQVVEAEEDQRRQKHQEQLAKKMLDRGLNRLKGGNILTIEDAKQSQKKLLDEYRAYATSKELPTLKPRCIVVDMEKEAIIVPINGIPVPFHISTLKNATKSDEGQYSYLRVNFHTPQATVSRGLGRPDNSPKFPGFGVQKGSCAAFIKEFTFRSSNPLNLNECLRKIKELRKRATDKATHQLEKDSLVEQQSLITERGRSHVHLSDVSVRPPMAKGKNNIGVLEAHQNGFRYRCRSGVIDIIYSNIRNAFFQEANKELLVLVHFHLKNEIMVGTKKAKDIQFYVQVMEAVVKLNEGRRRQFDQDELEEEQQERELRNRTNKTFLKFTKDVEERYGMEFDVPYRQLEFVGSPKSISVTLLPTVSCIVNLTEWPPFILNLEDVEVAHFERVIFQLRMFDMVFIMKGFEDDPAATGRAAKDYWLRISSIPMEELTPLKRYLDEQNIKYYEGKASLQWNEVLKSIRSDLGAFYENGGWDFLSVDGPEGEEGAQSDEQEDSLDGDAEFAPESDEVYESRSESSDSDSDASDAVRELEGDSDEGEVDLSSGEEGETWEEMERQAYRDDMRKGRGSDEEDEGRGGRGGKRSKDRRDQRRGSSKPSSTKKRGRRER